MSSHFDQTPNGIDDLLAGLEQRVVEASRVDNRRRRRLRATRLSMPTAVVAGVGAAALGAFPGGSSVSASLVAIAQAADAVAPTWSHMDIWTYNMDTAVSNSRATNYGIWRLADERRSGNEITTNASVASDQSIALSTTALGQTFKQIAAGTVPTHKELSSQSGSPFPEVDAGDDPPTTVPGWQKVANKVNYGSTCGEKAMVVAADVLQVPGVAPEARRALIEALGSCSGVSVTPNATDPLGRSGTAISATGTGSGIAATTTLVLDKKTGEPLSLVSTNDAAIDTGHWQLDAGTVITADVFQYDK